MGPIAGLTGASDGRADKETSIGPAGDLSSIFCIYSEGAKCSKGDRDPQTDSVSVEIDPLGTQERDHGFGEYVGGGGGGRGAVDGRTGLILITRG